MKVRPQTDERAGFDERLRLAPVTGSVRGLPFEGVMRVLRQHLNDAHITDLLTQTELGVTTIKRMNKYPLKQFIAFEREAAERVASDTFPFEEAVFTMGAAAIDLFFESIAGRTMKMLAGDEPHRLLSNVPNGYDVLVSFGERSYEKVNATSGIFRFGDEYLGPLHTTGVFDAGLRAVFNVDAQFDLVQSSASTFTLEIAW